MVPAEVVTLEGHVGSLWCWAPAASLRPEKGWVLLEVKLSWTFYLIWVFILQDKIITREQWALELQVGLSLEVIFSFVQID